MSDSTTRLLSRPWAALLVVVACAGIAFHVATAAEAQAPTAAEAVAYEYMEARDRADAAAALALFSDDSIVVDSPLVTLDHHNDVFELFDVLEWDWDVDGCVETASGPLAEVECTYATENAWSRAVAAPPLEGRMRFAIENGQIREMYHDFDRAAWLPDVERLFTRWLTNNHPADVGTMWEPEGFTRADDADNGLGERLVPRLTAESVELFGRYAAEYAVAVN